MLRIFIFILVGICCRSSLALNESNDISRFEGSEHEKNITAKELRERIEITGEIYIADANGKLLNKGHEFRSWKFGRTGDLMSNWSFTQTGMKEIALRHHWTISDDGTITAHIEQFDSMKKDSSDEKLTPQKLIRQETIEVKDFAPISWIASSNEKEHVVVRFTPHLNDQHKTIEASQLPISLQDAVIYDNQGHVWGHVHGIEGRYVAFKTSLGLVAISFAPFKGAQDIGSLEGNEISIDAGADLKIYFLSSQPILSSKMPVKIYGLVDKNSKTDRMTSLHVQSSGTEETFLKNLR